MWMVTNQSIFVAFELNIFQKKWFKQYKVNKQKWIQANDSIIFGYFCNGCINFVLKGESLLDYSNLFSPKLYENNDNKDNTELSCRTQ